MAKNRQEKKKQSPFAWLRLSLELIVVFVGISAGFFVNNYQENKRDSKQEHKYLESFHKNLVVDSINNALISTLALVR